MGDFTFREGKGSGPGRDFLGHQDVRPSLSRNLACCDNLSIAKKNGCAPRFSTAFSGRSQIDMHFKANFGTGSHHDFPELSSAEFCHHLNVSPGVIRQPPTVICAGRWESQVVQGQLWLSEFIFSMEVAKRQELGIHSVLATSAVPYSDGSFHLQPQHRLPHHSGDMVNSFIPFQIQGF